ncbi:MAG TPA: prepilin-type N-terminal cleavage/methylation domain-containing protein [Candidatus Binatia bacterium]|nr:prepilin-type N-terminal cleavage/methylation domain-containing protein [Candidatus Binatia bacterium]
MGDGGVTPAPISHRGARGFTLMELLMALALGAVLMGIALPHASKDQFNLWTAQTQLLGDLRTVRTDAITKGVHFQITIDTPVHYTMNRMKQGANGAWSVDVSYGSRALPTNVTFLTGVNDTFEFNTRGMLILPGQATTLTLSDSSTHLSRNVTVWPSGQVAPL